MSTLFAEVDFAVPEGFVVSVVANDTTVHDAFCMTLDNRGRPVVSGPGYVRTLIDEDKDGFFERFVNWATLPAQGAQGLWSENRSLYWVGDKGLWRSDDLDGDLIGDGPAKQVLALPTGGEHDAHAIRRGPDGYWYLIVGNYAADIQKINNDGDAAVKKPRAGTIWRISPDFSQRGAWVHGLRNAYDFDFLANGQIVTYDSDEEREVSLPWYRPTRVLVMSPGCDAGWVDSAWFDMDHRVTMPQVISRLGRGSPTGVAVYHHHAFPVKYREAAFVLDWTFGRVIAVYPQPTDTTETTAKPSRFMAETFMQATGTAGFAPTDVCIEPDGSLLFCVGGRGTTGAIYRVRYTGSLDEEKVAIKPVDVKNSKYSESQLKSLADVLSKPCPWDSWSSGEWLSLLQDLSPDAFESILDESLEIESSAPQTAGQWRRRAAQMLAFANKTPTLETVRQALHSNCAVTVSAAWWLLGRTPVEVPKESYGSIIDEAMQSAGTQSAGTQSAGTQSAGTRSAGKATSGESSWDHLLGGMVQRQRYEAMGLRHWPVPLDPVIPDLNWQQRNAIRQVQLWAISRAPTNKIRQVSSSASLEPIDNLAAKCLFGSGAATVDAVLMDRLAIRASAKEIGGSPQEILEALSLLQAALGDFRHTVPLQQAPPQIHATDGYRALYSRKVPEKVREGWARWCLSLVGQTDHPDQVVIETEVLRTLAMLEPMSAQAVDFCLSRIHEQSHPTSDLHALVALGCCKSPRSKSQSMATAKSLPGVLDKVKVLGLNTDNSWNKRLEQIFKQLVQQDPSLPTYLTQSDQDIEPSTVFWLEWCPAPIQAASRSRISGQLVSIPTSKWNEELVRFACSETIDVRLAKKLRSEASSPPTAMVLNLLSKSPSPEDYGMMIESLAVGTRDLWPTAWKGLAKMPAEKAADEFRTLALLWAKLKNAPLTEISTASLLTRLRTNAWKLKLTGVPSKDGWDEWSAFFSKNLDDATLSKLNEFNGPPADWLAAVKESATLTGDASRGEALFVRAKCSQCHGGGNALGPSLTGISRRFSNEDLFRAIYEPSRDISDRYRSVKVLTTDGEVLVGMMVYESTDGITLQAADGKLLRINQADIENKSNSPISLMPSGLLDAATARDLADLYAHLKRL